MRIEYPHRHERFGAVRIHDTTQVIELDSGLDGDSEEATIQGRLVNLVPPAAVNAVERSMAVVVPTKNERRKVIDGVLSGIPHDCLIVLVSASDRDPIDRYEIETGVVERFCHSAERAAVTVHQDDPGLADALAHAGLPDLIGGDSVRAGKGEAMIVGMLIAAAAGKSHVGFIDADNYVPGAVHEYVKVFAAGLHLAPTPYAMVRISWQSKPKIEAGRLVFNRWGRTTHITNRFLNLLLSTYNGFGTDVIRTGNSGEHAISLELAKRLRFAGGFAVEPYEFVDLFEQFGGALPSPHPEVARSLVDIFQVETRNPHFHEDKGDDHVADMRLESLSALLGSPLTPETVQSEIRQFLDDLAIDPDILAQPHVYPAWERADLETFADHLRKAATFVSVPRRRPTGILVEEPL
ncbi:MAG: mannosyl-3-phosphoglycerate synthase [Acidimicrobiia bacterium]